MFTHRQRATVKAFLSEWTEEYVCVRVCVCTQLQHFQFFSGFVNAQ